MIKVVNEKGLRGAVYDNILSQNRKDLLVFCQWGHRTKEAVWDVSDTHKRTTDRIRVAVNENEEVDIPAFISASLSRKKENEKLIIVTCLPFGKEKADALMAAYEGEFECVRHAPDAVEWVQKNRNLNDSGLNEINGPVLDFIDQFPRHYCLEYWQRPNPNTQGPSRETWTEVSQVWGNLFYDEYVKWPSKDEPRKIHELLLFAASVFGPSYDSLFEDLQRFLINTKAYDRLVPRKEPKYFDLCNGEDSFFDGSIPKEEEPKATFTDLFDEKGNLIW